VVVYKTFTKATRLPNKANICRAEVYAVSLAMVLNHCSKEKNFIIFSELCLSGFKVELNSVYSIVKGYTHLTNSGKTIVLCWIPSHVNIQGNEGWCCG